MIPVLASSRRAVVTEMENTREGAGFKGRIKSLEMDVVNFVYQMRVRVGS